MESLERIATGTMVSMERSWIKRQNLCPRKRKNRGNHFSKAISISIIPENLMANFIPITSADHNESDSERLRNFHAQFKSSHGVVKLESLQEICRLALKAGQPFIAFDLIQNVPSHILNDELIHLFGLASITLGSIDVAIAFLDKHVSLKNFSHLTLLGRVYKDAWYRFKKIEHKQTSLEMAYGYYKRALQIAIDAKTESDEFYSAINLATLALRLNLLEESEGYAQFAKTTCEGILLRKKDDYWLLATLGEANLLLGNATESKEYYIKAFSMAGKNYPHIASMKKQFEIVQSILNDARLSSRDLFPIPLVCCFTGHMIDEEGKIEKRFTNDMVGQVRESIGSAIVNNNIGFSFSSAASGSDIIFLQEMQSRGLETNIILPYDIDAFVVKSVKPAGEYWVNSFFEVLKNAGSVTVIRDDEEHDDHLAFVYTNQVINGLAKIKVSILCSELISMAVWDQRITNAPGGTSHALEQWNLTEHKNIVIPIGDLKLTDKVSVNVSNPKSSRLLVGILFADAVGFSKLRDKQITSFETNFLGKIASVLNLYEKNILFRNTWGDGLYLVSRDVEKLGELALKIQEELGKCDWSTFGLPKEMSLRIALHAGPVSEVFDPIMRAKSYMGHFVNEAARIEPITPRGEVYASQAFAALSTSINNASNIFEYVGDIPLAKSFGNIQMYHLRLK
ncbi:MAG: hypothetical protein EOP48_00135 [Sphingobacteriales bacterium]|nr:MAG: hypothetical protein EOP48_00135 [Sphingobacteriales bacterium]